MTITEFLSPNTFVGQALWVLLALSLLTAPMGCFVVWRKLSYFGATLSHSALLGAILGLLTGIGVLTGVVSFTMLLGLGLSFWLNHRRLSGDTVLGMIAHFTLAIGVIAVSVMDDLRIDLKTYLFGDVLAVSTPMFYVMALLSVLGFIVVMACWRGFVNLSIAPDIAKVEGYPTRLLDIIFTLTLSLTIALGMMSIGVLLIVAMLIIPAATARLLAASLQQMALIAWVLTALSIIVGLWLAYWLDFPAGPTIVVVSGALFVLLNSGQWLLKRT